MALPRGSLLGSDTKSLDELTKTEQFFLTNKNPHSLLECSLVVENVKISSPIYRIAIKKHKELLIDGLKEIENIDKFNIFLRSSHMFLHEYIDVLDIYFDKFVKTIDDIVNFKKFFEKMSYFVKGFNCQAKSKQDEVEKFIRKKIKDSKIIENKLHSLKSADEINEFDELVSDKIHYFYRGEFKFLRKMESLIETPNHFIEFYSKIRGYDSDDEDVKNLRKSATLKIVKLFSRDELVNIVDIIKESKDLNLFGKDKDIIYKHIAPKSERDEISDFSGFVEYVESPLYEYFRLYKCANGQFIERFVDISLSRNEYKKIYIFFQKERDSFRLWRTETLAISKKIALKLVDSMAADNIKQTFDMLVELKDFREYRLKEYLLVFDKFYYKWDEIGLEAIEKASTESDLEKIYEESYNGSLTQAKIIEELKLKKWM